ncbi:hypothetical protein EUTSA_v10028248mg [Eutrema salsugineum]|uniref:Uncharacterized protein n=1 Tax=Eutrema salsugineum TaxID=72664 RepID=V4LTS5_EUTSA|nr:uncharacterized protein LOC18022835 [Eutrema salsugineum]ESQ47224.1 hypothetical protein EUTSA_v10028248mg [Eutrema salsugineum]
MHVDSMKKARVSSVYEGKERNKSRKGEETRKDHSKHARMTAKARMNVHKESMKYLPKHKKPMMIMKSMRKNEEKLDDPKSVVARVLEKEKVEKKDDVAVKNLEEKTEMPFSGLVEDWPQTLTYEEEWTWFAFAFGWGWWWRYDAVMSGESWFN